jgi:ribosome-associated toxin RatA of RatAB toxin-antitoxin module
MWTKVLTKLPAVLALLILCAAPALAQPDEKQMARLQKGAVIVSSQIDPATTDRVSTGFVIFSAPQELVWKVITSYAQYPEFIPDVTAAKVEKREAGKVWLEMNFKNTLGFPDFKCRLLVEENQTAGTVSFKMEQGDFEKYYASWKLTGLGKDQVLAEYRLYKYVAWWWFPMLPNYWGNDSLVMDYLGAFKRQVQLVRVQDSSQSEKLIKPIWRKATEKEPEKPAPAEGQTPKEPKPDEKGNKLPNVQPENRRPEYRY